MPEELENAIREAAKEPAEASVDGQTVKQHPLRDQIEAEALLERAGIEAVRLLWPVTHQNHPNGAAALRVAQRGWLRSNLGRQDVLARHTLTKASPWKIDAGGAHYPRGLTPLQVRALQDDPAWVEVAMVYYGARNIADQLEIL